MLNECDEDGFLILLISLYRFLTFFLGDQWLLDEAWSTVKYTSVPVPIRAFNPSSRAFYFCGCVIHGQAYNAVRGHVYILANFRGAALTNILRIRVPIIIMVYRIIMLMGQTIDLKHLRDSS